MFIFEREYDHTLVTWKKHAIIDLTGTGIDWLIRLSPRYFNNMTEIENVTTILQKIPTYE